MNENKDNWQDKIHDSLWAVWNCEQTVEDAKKELVEYFEEHMNMNEQ